MDHTMHWVIKKEDIGEFRAEHRVIHIVNDLLTWECAAFYKGVLYVSAQTVDSWLKCGYKLYDPTNQRILKRVNSIDN